MAIHILTTPSGVNEPALPRAGLLRSAGAPCPARHDSSPAAIMARANAFAAQQVERAALWPVTHDPRSAVEILDEIRREIEKPELPPGPLMAAATALHMRRALEQALDHGTALLAALGLPRLVDNGFVPIDGDALGNALEVVISHLDAIDAPGEDLEPSLGAPENHTSFNIPDPDYGWRSLLPDQRRWAQGVDDGREGDVVDEPHDGRDDDEYTLGWAANVSQLGLGPNTADGDETAPERFGRGFVRCAPDDHEDGRDAEGLNDEGGDEAEEIGIHPGLVRGRPLTRAERAAVRGLARRALAMREVVARGVAL